MKRRDFLKASAVVGLGAIAAPGYVAKALAAERATVAKATGGTPAALVRNAVGALGGMERFVSAGDVVVVKPNIGWDRTPEQAANTHPEVVIETVKLALAAGAARVLVFDRTCNDARRCYTRSGIGPALEAFGDDRVELSHMDDRRYRTVNIPGGVAFTEWPFYEDALDADKFINVPVAKHHGLSGLTLGMKNVMGVIGGNRSMLHRNMSQSLADINRAVRSHLTLVDATRILLRNGPQGGDLDDVKVLDTVIASADVVAADTVAAALFGKGPGELGFLKRGEEAGLGVADAGRIDVLEVSG